MLLLLPASFRASEHDWRMASPATKPRKAAGPRERVKGRQSRGVPCPRAAAAAAASSSRLQAQPHGAAHCLLRVTSGLRSLAVAQYRVQQAVPAPGHTLPASEEGVAVGVYSADQPSCVTQSRRRSQRLQKGLCGGGGYKTFFASGSKWLSYATAHKGLVVVVVVVY